MEALGKGSRLVVESFVAQGEPHGSSMLSRGYSHDGGERVVVVIGGAACG